MDKITIRHSAGRHRYKMVAASCETGRRGVGAGRGVVEGSCGAVSNVTHFANIQTVFVPYNGEFTSPWLFVYCAL